MLCGYLMDCVHELISTVIPGVPADRIMATIGIANRLCEFRYSNIPFYIVDGRGYGDPLQLMDALGIPYEPISAEEVFDSSECKNLMFFCAKDLLMGVNSLNPHAKQLLFFYTGFFVKNIEQNKITLGICKDENEYCISRDELERLSRISTIPMSYSCRFVRITDPDYTINYDFQRNQLAKNINKFLEDMDMQSEIVSGSRMYDAFADVICDLAKAGESPNCNPKAEIFRQKMLTASLNVGTVGLYRREFSDAVRSISGSEETESISNAFLRSAAIWRELGKRAMKQMSTNALFDNEYERFAVPAIVEIKKIETDAMQKLRMAIS